MNTLDIIILVLLGSGALLGVYWGLIRQVLSIIGVVAAASIAGRTYPLIADLLAAVAPTAPDMLNVVAFILVFTVVSVIVSVVATLLRLFVGLLFLGWLDHVLGGLLGLLQSALVVAVLLALLTAFPAAGLSSQVAGSRFAAWWGRPVLWCLPLLPERFRLPNTLMFGADVRQPLVTASTRRPLP